MRSIRYLDFDILIERGEGQGEYEARVVAAPSGEYEPVDFTSPFSDLELENFLLKIGRRRNIVRGLDTQEGATVKEFGSQLFERVFTGNLRLALATSLSETDSEDLGLRMRLRLSDCPELADIPWEYLYDKSTRRFLALSEWTPVVRYLDLPGRVRKVKVNGPLRILGMASSPTDYPRLSVDDEWSKLNTALQGLVDAGRVELKAVPDGTLASLHRELRRADFHVFHYIGHGGFLPDGGDGVLVLEDAQGRGLQVSGQDLGVSLHDHRTLRLAVLNSCEGARAGITDPYAGTAQTLVQQGIPAVVAMQFEISDEAAITFSQVLYEAIADGYPLDAAMAEARKAVRNQPNATEWGTPVLYLRSPDGHVFDVTQPAIPPTLPPDATTPDDDKQVGAAPPSPGEQPDPEQVGAAPPSPCEQPDPEQVGAAPPSPGEQPDPEQVGAAPPSPGEQPDPEQVGAAPPSPGEQPDPEQVGAAPPSPGEQPDPEPPDSAPDSTPVEVRDPAGPETQILAAPPRPLFADDVETAAREVRPIDSTPTRSEAPRSETPRPVPAPRPPVPPDDHTATSGTSKRRRGVIAIVAAVIAALTIGVIAYVANNNESKSFPTYDEDQLTSGAFPIYETTQCDPATSINAPVLSRADPASAIKCFGEQVPINTSYFCAESMEGLERVRSEYTDTIADGTEDDSLDLEPSGSVSETDGLQRSYANDVGQARVYYDSESTLCGAEVQAKDDDTSVDTLISFIETGKI